MGPNGERERKKERQTENKSPRTGFSIVCGVVMVRNLCRDQPMDGVYAERVDLKKRRKIGLCLSMEPVVLWCAAI